LPSQTIRLHQTLHNIQLQATRGAYVHLCWLPMTKRKKNNNC